MGPPLARHYPGLPPLADLSPMDIAAYVLWLTEQREEGPGGD